MIRLDFNSTAHFKGPCSRIQHGNHKEAQTCSNTSTAHDNSSETSTIPVIKENKVYNIQKDIMNILPVTLM